MFGGSCTYACAGVVQTGQRRPLNFCRMTFALSGSISGVRAGRSFSGGQRTYGNYQLPGGNGEWGTSKLYGDH